MKSRGMFLFIILAFILTACNTSSSGSTAGVAIEISDAWARSAKSMMAHGNQSGDMKNSEKPMMGANGAAYMIIKNTGDMADKLLRAESQVSEVVELHISEMNDGVMKMRQVEYIEAPAGGQAELKPGGLHIMLIGLKQDLVEGESIDITLYFEEAGKVRVSAEVRAP